MFNRIFTRMRHDAHNCNASPGVSHSCRQEINHRRNRRIEHERYLDWANSSGLYKKLSDRQKQYLDKIEDILDQYDWNN